MQNVLYLEPNFITVKLSTSPSVLTTNPNVPNRNLLPTSWDVARQVRRTTATLMDFIGKYTARQVASCYSWSPSRAADIRSTTQKISHFFISLFKRLRQ